ncbi:MarR family transcriptional regulator [Paraclostridium ghonii]|uniref:MarR family winged helix-turn-helix transcriptional regulator n=1 Tax=Paraclostridium ghonii TaxID=29358 RepID=UPI00202D005A|nr:MarR family transcriptional regulator [Paeniclostridium ghonii]MCM0168103.1 winged helix-turn-helix transcriptional regulator [Paeniclostridium ghonii]
MQDKYIVYFISRTKDNMIKFIDKKLKSNNLNDLIPTHGNILTALYESNGKLTMKEISKKIGKDKSTVTSLINKLIDLGYVKKDKCTIDKRITYISLTHKALNIKGRFDLISSELKETAYKNFTDEEKEEFLRLLKKMNKNFKDENNNSN